MLNRMQISMPEMLKELSAMMEPQAEVNGLAFSMEAREIRHQNFYGDKLRINQILINILSNAIKFTPKGGRVEFLAEETDRGCKAVSYTHLAGWRTGSLGQGYFHLWNCMQPAASVVFLFYKRESTGSG